ncbi:MAG: hypothetical protein U5L72_03390 [Bacteroidales bacterium]|nr:hypothetical protein [Bacteroidales bacterium]
MLTDRFADDSDIDFLVEFSTIDILGNIFRQLYGFQRKS